MWIFFIFYSTLRFYRYTIYKDFLTLADYEIADGMSLEMSYQ